MRGRGECRRAPARLPRPRVPWHRCRPRSHDRRFPVVDIHWSRGSREEQGGCQIDEIGEAKTKARCLRTRWGGDLGRGHAASFCVTNKETNSTFFPDGELHQGIGRIWPIRMSEPARHIQYSSLTEKVDYPFISQPSIFMINIESTNIIGWRMENYESLRRLLLGKDKDCRQDGLQKFTNFSRFNIPDVVVWI